MVVILLKVVLTGIALTSDLDTSSTDGASSLQITGRKCQLHFSFLDDELSDEGFPFFVAHLKFTSLTCCQECLYVFLGDVGSVVLSEHDELTVVPRSVVIFFELSHAHPKGCSVMWPCPQMGQMPIDFVLSIFFFCLIKVYLLLLSYSLFLSLTSTGHPSP